MNSRASAAAVRAAVGVLGPLARAHMPIGPLTTYRVGGAATLGVVVAGLEDLVTVASAVDASGLDVLVVGRGSNLLVADGGFHGIAVVLDGEAFAAMEVRGCEVTAGAGLPLPALARRSVEAGLTGLEWAVGVPGSVGGGVRMNAGGHGSEMAESLSGCTVVDLSTGAGAGPQHWAPADLGHGYRRSLLLPSQVVTEAAFVLSEGDPDEGRETIREIVRWRREHQPGGQNAGSVFVNPPSRSAGSLVETADMKGLRIGSAEVSRKHANFIQADAGGSADDVYALMGEMRRRVHERWGVDLHTEIRLVGFPDTAYEPGAPAPPASTTPVPGSGKASGSSNVSGSTRGLDT